MGLVDVGMVVDVVELDGLVGEGQFFSGVRLRIDEDHLSNSLHQVEFRIS